MPQSSSDPAPQLVRAAEAAAAGRQDEAFLIYSRILTEIPNEVEALKGAARSLLALRRLNDSAQTWEAAREIAPNDPEVLYQCGVTHFRRGDMKSACAFFDKTCDVDPVHYGARGMTVLAQLYSDGDEAKGIRQAQRHWVDQRKPSPFVSHIGAGQDPDRRLRIGYLSSDFRGHSVGFNMLPLFQRLDRSQFQLYAYAEVAHPDAATRLFEAASDGWRSTVGLSDPEVAQAIISDEIDILIVLAAHLDENRPFVARFRPAPIQVSHHDVCSSGLPEMEYFLGDSYVTPRAGTEWYSERVVRLPTFSVHAIPAEAPPIGPLPAQSNGYITFGSFNAPQKLSDECLDCWAGLLKSLPEARLVLKHFEAYSETATRERIVGRMTASGIDPARLTIIDAVDPRSRHLEAYGTVDIGLDPFPFSGATTTFEALLMGVPVVSLAGSRFAGRCSAATLQAVGLGGLHRGGC